MKGFEAPCDSRHILVMIVFIFRTNSKPIVSLEISVRRMIAQANKRWHSMEDVLNPEKF